MSPVQRSLAALLRLASPDPGGFFMGSPWVHRQKIWRLAAKNGIFLQKMNEDLGKQTGLISEKYDEGFWIQLGNMETIASKELWFHLLVNWVNCMMLHGIDQQSRLLLHDYHRQAKESEAISPGWSFTSQVKQVVVSVHLSVRYPPASLKHGSIAILKTLIMRYLPRLLDLQGTLFKISKFPQWHMLFFYG